MITRRSKRNRTAKQQAMRLYHNCSGKTDVVNLFQLVLYHWQCELIAKPHVMQLACHTVEQSQ